MATEQEPRSAEQEIRDAIVGARAAYLSLRETGTVAEVDTAARRVRDLQVELGRTLAVGAKPCRGCGHEPHGMLRTPAHGRTPAIYEVGCLHCTTVSAKDRSPAHKYGQGLSPEEAVSAWNKSQWV